MKIAMNIMIKITAVLIVMCISDVIGMSLYVHGLPMSEVMRIKLNKLTPFEKVCFMLMGWIIIATLFCVAISAVMLIWRYL